MGKPTSTAKMTLVKLARLHKKITLAEIEKPLVEKKYISKYAFTRIENGAYNVPKKTQKRICEILELNRQAAFSPSGKARPLKWSHILKLQKMILKKGEKK